MATEGSTPQRAWRAACPGCGAPVEFRSAASASAVCSFCRSTLLRDGAALQRIGVSAELFDDHSPLQLGAAGRHQGVAFTLVGRLQYGYDAGTWNEWHALFENGRSGWLSEDNGAYVFAFDQPLNEPAPPAATLRVGGRQRVQGRSWDIASVTTARLVAAQGELPFAPQLRGEFVVAELRNAQGEVGSLDYSDPARAHWSIGRSVALFELALSGLRETTEKTLGARSLECPNCGTSLEVKLATTQSIACAQCKAVVDVSSKLGEALAHYRQANAGHDGAEPTLPLGSTAVLALGRGGPLPWTVVGMLERCNIPADRDDETTYWREYLVYHRQAGFAFLVDAEDGWSWARPITGAPQRAGNRVIWEAVHYVERYTYAARVTWVLGEFYWRVQRGEQAVVNDFVGTGTAHRKRLSREQTGSEVTWSAGEAIDASVLAKAFGVPVTASGGLSGDASPLSQLSKLSTRGTPAIVWIVVAFIALMFVLDSCSDDCDDVRNTFGAASAEYRRCVDSGGSGVRRGGSFGGFSSGGGHK